MKTILNSSTLKEREGVNFFLKMINSAPSSLKYDTLLAKALFDQKINKILG